MGELILGRHSYSFATRRGTDNNVTIGNFCSIAEGVIFDCGFNHNSSFITTFPLKKIWSELPSNIKVKGDITIGHDVWIGENAIIMSGVEIGSGAIIACGAVVTKNVAPYSIVGGVPAKIIKFRFLIPYVKELLKIKWWDWSDEKIRENAELLLSNNIEELIKKNL